VIFLLNNCQYAVQFNITLTTHIKSNNATRPSTSHNNYPAVKACELKTNPSTTGSLHTTAGN